MPDYITYWFPFTVNEVAVALEAIGVEKAEARREAEVMAAEMADATERAEGYGGMEIGVFLDPIARLSDDAARRVAAYRQGLTFDRNWDAKGGNGI